MHIPGARVSVGMFWGCTWEGRRQVAGGTAGKRQGMGGLEHREGQIPGQCAGAGGKNKGAPILCLWLQTAAPSPQLPVPPTSLGITLGMRSRAGASPSPPRPQTTGSFSSASSDLQAPDPVSVPGRVICREAHTAPFFLSPSP